MAYLEICYRCPELAIDLYDKGKQVVVYDPEDEIEKSTGIHVVKTPTQLMALMTMRGGVSDIPNLHVPSGLEYSQTVQDVRKLFGEAINNRQITRNTGRDRTREILLTGLKNTRLLASKGFVDPSRGPWKGSTVFIVSAGPSLDKNVHLLEQAAGIGPVISVNTSVRPVVKAMGRVPYMMSIEAKYSGHHLDGMAPYIEEAVVDITAHADTHKLLEGSITFSAANSIARALFRELVIPFVNYGASVATAAVSYALHLGATKIVLVGQDLSYADDGRVYASGTAYEDLRWEHSKPGMIISGKGHHLVEKEQPFTEAEGWGGTKCITVTDLLMFSRWFESLPGSKAVAHVEFINATEGGLHIPGWKDQELSKVLRNENPSHIPPLKQAVHKLPTVEVEKHLSRHHTCVLNALQALDQNRFRDMYRHVLSSSIARAWMEHVNHPRINEAGISRVLTNGKKDWCGFPKVAYLDRWEGELRELANVLEAV